MRVTPKMRERPDATRKRNIALARPLRSCTRRRDIPSPCPFGRGERGMRNARPGEKGHAPHPAPSPEGRGRCETLAPLWGGGRVRGSDKGRGLSLVARAHLLHFVVGRQHLLAGDIFVI